MDASDFSEKDFKDRDFGEEDLAGLAAALGMSYEIGWYDALLVEENKSYTVRVWAKMKGLKSKCYAAFVYGGNMHTTRYALEITLFRAKFAGGDRGAITPRDARRIRDEMSAHVVKKILSGCAIKISRKRRIVVPKSSSVEELRFRLAITGGRA